MIEAWAVGNRPYPEKIFAQHATNKLYIFEDYRSAENEVAARRTRDLPAVVFKVLIMLPEEVEGEQKPEGRVRNDD